jgi:hypothetical protein
LFSSAATPATWRTGPTRRTAAHMAEMMRRSDHAENRAGTLDRGDHAAHMAGMMRRSDHTEDRTDTFDRGGSTEHMANMLRRSAARYTRATYFGAATTRRTGPTRWTTAAQRTWPTSCGVGAPPPRELGAKRETQCTKLYAALRALAAPERISSKNERLSAQSFTRPYE